MSDEPTIPQIVRALTTIDDRHSQSLREREALHMEALRKKELSLQELELVLERREIKIEILKSVIEELCLRIRRTSEQCAKDERACYYSEPQKLRNLLGREYDPQKLIDQAYADSTEPEEQVCRLCSHPGERHTHTLPEEGYREYCTECSGAEEHHEFDGSTPSPEDKCECGCKRKQHQGPEGLGGAQCADCPGDDERSWRHEFFWSGE